MEQIAPHMWAVDAISKLAGLSDRDCTRIGALAGAMRDRQLGKRRHVDDLVAALEKEAHRLGNNGSNFGRVAAGHIRGTVESLLRRNEHLPDVDHTQNGQTAEVGTSSETASRVGITEPLASAHQDNWHREDGRPLA